MYEEYMPTDDETFVDDISDELPTTSIYSMSYKPQTTKAIGILLALCALLGLGWWGYTHGRFSSACSETTVACAIKTMHDAGVTTITSPDDPSLNDRVTRQVAAQMFVALEKSVHPEKALTSTASCIWSDASYIQSAYTSAAQEACQRGIMHGSQGRFFPLALVTSAESVAMLARMHGNTVPNSTTGQTRFAPLETIMQTQGMFRYLGVNPKISDRTPITMKELLAAMTWYAGDGK
jgi:hypothetical protein